MEINRELQTEYYSISHKAEKDHYQIININSGASFSLRFSIENAIKDYDLLMLRDPAFGGPVPCLVECVRVLVPGRHSGLTGESGRWGMGARVDPTPT